MKLIQKKSVNSAEHTIVSCCSNCTILENQDRSGDNNMAIVLMPTTLQNDN